MRGIAVLLAVIIPFVASVAIAEDPVHFADPVLESVVERQLGVTDPTPSDMLNLTDLLANGLGVTELTGLEYALNLRTLNLWGNHVADVNALRPLTRLVSLNLDGNQVTDITAVAGLTHMRTLYLSANQGIGDVHPLAGLMELTELDLGFNYSVSDLSPLAGLKNLTFLRLAGNLIVDVSGMAGLTKLRELSLGQNQISDIATLAGLTGLVTLDLRDNPLDDADMPALAGMINLTSLQIGNYYTDNMKITHVSFLRRMRKLTSLQSWCNALEDITPLEGLTQMTHLFLGGEKLTDISPVANLTQLAGFSLWGSRVSDLTPLCRLRMLTQLDVEMTPISDLRPLRGLTALTSLRVSEGQVTDLAPLVRLTQLTYLHLRDNWLTDIRPLGELRNLRELYLHTDGYTCTCRSPRHSEITDISALANLTDLRTLTLGFNPVTDLSPLVNLPNLSSLDLIRCGLSDVSSLTAMTSLDELWLDANPLTAKACATDIPLIQRNNPGVVIHYDGCKQWWTLTTSSTEGGSVVMPGEDAFVYFSGDLVPVEAVAEEGYQFTHWSGTAVDANALLDPCAPHTSVSMRMDNTLVAHFKAQDQPWGTVYFSDFKGKVGPEWSRNAVESTPAGKRRFLGQFSNETVTLALGSLPPHQKMRVSCDLFVIRSWEGSLTPDLWTLAVDGRTLLNTAFANRPSPSDQAFPGTYPRDQHPPQTGAAELDSLGYRYWSFIGPTSDLPQSAVYHLVFTVGHEADTANVEFAGSSLEDISNESWGLDNVRIEVLRSDVDPATPSAVGDSTPSS